jgi:microcompartment protein CcmK/EutM
MHIGKITGTLVATRKDEKLVGCKLMITQPLNSKLEPKGEEIVAIDTVGAGIGEIVIYSSGTAARNAARKPDSPIDVAIVGIIDSMDIPE